MKIGFLGLGNMGTPMALRLLAAGHELSVWNRSEGRTKPLIGIWPKSAASIAEVLKENGYSTAALGKWHDTPFSEISPVGPFDHWPTGLGFEYFYGFQGGEDSQWNPQLYRGTSPVEPDKTPEQGYNLNIDLANDSIYWLHQHDVVAPDKPFFRYFATGAIHAPHYVPKEWIEKHSLFLTNTAHSIQNERPFCCHSKSSVLSRDCATKPLQWRSPSRRRFRTQRFRHTVPGTILSADAKWGE